MEGQAGRMDGLNVADFAGDWAIARVIADHRAGHEARFAGRANLSWQGEGLYLWAESGRMEMPGGQEFEAARRYLWRQDGVRIEVLFEDGRAFHGFDPRDPVADHWCDPDAYAVRYDLSDWPVWRAVWRVRGPRKDYTMSSEHRRP